MTSSTDYDGDTRYGLDENLGLGWKAFAGTMLIISGSINMFQGLVAITNASYYENLGGGHIDLPATDKISTWGWIVLIWGLLVFCAGFAAFTGHMWARITGIAAASINMLLQIAFLSAFPIMGLTVILLDALVIWGLTVHGRRVDMDKVV